MRRATAPVPCMRPQARAVWKQPTRRQMTMTSPMGVILLGDQSVRQECGGSAARRHHPSCALEVPRERLAVSTHLTGKGGAVFRCMS